MAWLREHWRTVAGAIASGIGIIEPVWKSIRWLITVLGDIDFVVTRSGEPGWVGKVTAYILNPPDILPVILVVIGILFIAWDVRRHRSKANRPHTMVTGSLSRSVPLIEMTLSTSQLEQASAWLHFGCTAFNGSGHELHVHSATGRVTVAGQELSANIELSPHANDAGIKPLYLFRFTLKVFVNDKAAAHILALVQEKKSVSARFQGASIAVTFGSSAEPVSFDLRLPNDIHFEIDDFRQDPRFRHKLINRQSRET